MLLVLGVTAASAQEGHAVGGVPPGANPDMIQSYAGVVEARLGDYRGKLVCLRCDLAPGPEHMETCRKEGHRHALSMDGGSMIHPLLAGTPEALAQINSTELHGKEVTVHGKFYPATGMIFVDRVTPK